MKGNKLILIIAVLIMMSFSNSKKWHAAPYRIATAFTSDSLTSYISQNDKAQLYNNYYIKEDKYRGIIAKLHALNKPHLYNRNGLRIMMAPDESCSSPILLPSFSSELSVYKTDTTDSLNDLLSSLELMTTRQINEEWPTAVLYWSKSIGLEKDDHVFLWEQAFINKFEGKINIVKVSTDVNSSWSAGAQLNVLKTIQKLLDNINATDG